MPATHTTPGAPGATDASGADLLARTDLQVADAVGSLMELWGFRRQLGRIWAVLFLSDRPLCAPELCDRLQISTGLLSMSLAELRQWGVVRGVEVAGDRKEHYQAESNVWKLVTHVLKEREMAAVRTALAALERALGEVREAALDGDPTVRAQARTRVRRLQQLIELSRAALHVLRLLVDSARADVGPLKALSEMLSGRRGG